MGSRWEAGVEQLHRGRKDNATWEDSVHGSTLNEVESTRKVGDSQQAECEWAGVENSRV